LTYQVLGIADASLQEAVADSLSEQGRRRALVVHGASGMDEISPHGKTRVYDVGYAGKQVYDIDPVELGMAEFDLESIKGGDSEANAMIIRGVLASQSGPYRDVFSPL